MACCKDDSDIFHPFSSPGGKSHPLPILVFCKFNNPPSWDRIIGVQKGVQSKSKNKFRGSKESKSMDKFDIFKTMSVISYYIGLCLGFRSVEEQKKKRFVKRIKIEVTRSIIMVTNKLRLKLCQAQV